MKDYIAYLKFDDISQEELVECLNKDIKEKKKVTVVTPNLDGMRVSYKNKELRNFINSSEYVTIDGKPVLWIAKWYKKKNFKYKISGSDLVPRVLEEANKYSYSICIFGGKEGVAEKAKENILKQYTNIKTINTICPEFGFEKDEEKSQKYINQINEFNSDIVLLCTGFPKTELFYMKHQEQFASRAYFFVGATVDFLAGNIKRAPKWMSNCGLEWLYRLSKDFRRLFKRYWLDFWFLDKMWFMCHFKKKKIQRDINGTK